jgi:hypothetical protein
MFFEPRAARHALPLAAALCFSAAAHAADPALNAFGQTGGLVIPYAFTLPEGMVEAQYNSFIDPRYGRSANGAQTYWGAVGLFPYVEISGGLSNYPADVHVPFSGEERFLFRHLMANVKVEIPKFFRDQPDIAFGIGDIGGQTHFFRSKYGVVSQTLGPLTLSAGYGSGDRLDGPFGGAQLSLWNTGVSLLAEHDSKTPYAGVRYQSPRVSWLADANVIGTVMHGLRSTDGVTPRTSFSIGVQIPLGKRFREHAAIDSTYVDSTDIQPQPSSLDDIAAQLFAAGLERVRVGVHGHDLIVEYENHRYNQNEADALGIALGVASMHAPEGIEQIHVVIKKADLALGEVSVERDAFARFIAGGPRAPLTMRFRPTFDADAIAWHGDAHLHGLTRIQIDPVLRYLYGTEYGMFDVSLGANIQGFVPLWKGAELYASYVAPLYNTKNMDDGRIYDNYRLRGGLNSVALAQSFWIAPQVLNVIAVGKFDYSYVGAQNETTVFVPGRPDQIRLRLAYLHHEPGHDSSPSETTAQLTYRWANPAWKVWVEAGAARFVGGDKGPVATVTRWFDDVSVSVHGEHSGRGSFVGAAISFPLTLRQGMKPGVTQIDGPSSFGLDFQTRVGSTNYISSDAVQTMNFPYSTQNVLLNEGRFSGEYFETQLYRMRDAYLRYGRADAQ